MEGLDREGRWVLFEPMVSVVVKERVERARPAMKERSTGEGEVRDVLGVMPALILLMRLWFDA